MVNFCSQNFVGTKWRLHCMRVLLYTGNDVEVIWSTAKYYPRIFFQTNEKTYLQPSQRRPILFSQGCLDMKSQYWSLHCGVWFRQYCICICTCVCTYTYRHHTLTVYLNFKFISSRKHFFFFFIRRLTSFIKSFGLLNDVFPFCSILDTNCPIFYIQLTDILYYIVFPPLFGPSLGSYN